MLVWLTVCIGVLSRVCMVYHMYRSSRPCLYELLYVYEFSPVFVWLTVCIGVLSRVCMAYSMYKMFKKAKSLLDLQCRKLDLTLTYELYYHLHLIICMNTQWRCSIYYILFYHTVCSKLYDGDNSRN